MAAEQDVEMSQETTGSRRNSKLEFFPREALASSQQPPPTSPRTLTEASALCVPDEEYTLSSAMRDPPPESQRFVASLPNSLVRCLERFDDPLVQKIQAPLQGRFRSVLIYLAHLVWIPSRLEIAYSVPYFVLMLEQFDKEAILATFEFTLMAAVAQCMKRFLFRARPFAAGKAEGVFIWGSPMTSSFPSRTVIGATTFLCYIMLAIESPAEESQLSWGPRHISHWALVVALIIIVSWSRIFTGNHYPSCCISGFVIGLAVHFTGVLLARNHIRQCACEEPGSCSKKKMTSVATLWVCLSVPLGVFVVMSLGSEPFSVWRRSYQALSLLIPPLVFIYGFLCPSLSGNLIEVTENHSPSKQTLLTVLILTSIVSAAAAAPSSTHAIASSNVVNAAWFLMILVLALLSLITSRLVQQHENASVDNN